MTNFNLSFISLESASFDPSVENEEIYFCGTVPLRKYFFDQVENGAAPVRYCSLLANSLEAQTVILDFNLLQNSSFGSLYSLSVCTFYL